MLLEDAPPEDTQPRRKVERQVRQHAVALVHQSDLAQSTLATAIGLAPQTLNDWVRGQLGAGFRGRPPVAPDPLQLVQVQELLDQVGASISVPSLKALFHDIPRRALAELRDDYVQEHHLPPCHLLWRTPGVVWSADFTRPPNPIDGLFPRILVVRDLASRCTLLSLPCADDTAAPVVGALTTLFAEHGAPLVLKTDNGSAFTAHDTQALLAAHNVQNLLSPPLTPQYNGSVEATGGSVKAHTARVAFAQGRAACWTSDDLETARLLANNTSRPWGIFSPTPADAFASRPRISDTQRAAFLALVLACRQNLTATLQNHQRNRGQSPDPALNANQRATVARVVIRQALVELGHLFIRRPQIMSTHSTQDSSEN